MLTMRTYSGLAIALSLASGNALAFNRTIETVTVTQTSWSTILSCPVPTTVTVCNAQCPTSFEYVNNANVVYQTISECQSGQAVNIAGTLTTLTEPTLLTVEETISDLVLVPETATGSDLTAAATITNVIYPSAVTGNSGQVVTCQTGITTLGQDGVVLTNCPCTVQSTVLELTATGSGPLPTAMVSSSDYIVKIIYVYVIESIVEQIPTTVTTTATSVLTTISGEIATTTGSALPTIVPVESVIFLLEYDTTYDGVAEPGLRKRQASNSLLIPAALNDCLTVCAEQPDCRAASFSGSPSTCVPLIQFNTQTRRVSPGEVFAIVIYRPSAPISSSSPTSVGASTGLKISTDPGSSSSSGVRSSPVESLIPSSSGTMTSLITSMPASLDSTSTRKSNDISSSSARYPLSNFSISSTFLNSHSSSSSSVVSTSLGSSLSISSEKSSSTSSKPSSSKSLSSSSFVTGSSNTSTSLTSTLTTSSPVLSTSSSTTSTSLAPLVGCAVANELLGYAPAASYCSSAYPVTTYASLFNATITDTVVDTGIASTIYGSITLPAETTVQTIEETITQTSSIPVEATETDTTTT